MQVDDSEMRDDGGQLGKNGYTANLNGFIIQTWLQRNDEAHVRNSANESRLIRERLMAQIIHLQESSPDIRYCDRDFVFKSPEVLAQYYLNNLSIIRCIKRRSRQSRSRPNNTTLCPFIVYCLSQLPPANRVDTSVITQPRQPKHSDKTPVMSVPDNSHHHVYSICNHHPQIESDPSSVGSNHSSMSPTSNK